jgi:DTW domain-containing protein YfiP
VDNRTPVYVVQHPRERFHPFGTLRIARLGLTRLRSTVCFRPTIEPPVSLPRRAALLYPAADALDFDAVASSGPPEALVVIDGTWHHARGIFRNSPWLQRLPRYRIRPNAPGRYRIRRAPSPEHLSTVEAIVWALSRLEPATEGLHGLLDAFESMIDEQIRLRQERDGGRSRRAKPARGGGIPRVFIEGPERLVVVYGESCAAAADRSSDSRRVVQWTAVRPATGEVFERLVRPEHDRPTAAHLRHMGLDLDRAERGGTVREVRQAWRAFSRAGDVVVAWNQSTVDLLRSGLEDSTPALLLKAVYCNVRRGACGTIDEVLLRERLVPVAVPVLGRASQRLGNALALLRRLQSASL